MFEFISENSSVGYILEVDLKYPSELHELHNDYQLPPEKLKINQNMLSSYCFNIASENGVKIGGVDKLIPNLGNKVNMLSITEMFSCICH